MKSRCKIKNTQDKEKELEEKLNVLQDQYNILADELKKAKGGRKKPEDAFDRAMASIDGMRAGIREKPRPRRVANSGKWLGDARRSTLDEHLEAMRLMYSSNSSSDYQVNMRYITSRVNHLIKARRVFELGDERLFTPESFRELIFSRNPATG